MVCPYKNSLAWQSGRQEIVSYTAPDARHPLPQSPSRFNRVWLSGQATADRIQELRELNSQAFSLRAGPHKQCFGASQRVVKPGF